MLEVIGISEIEVDLSKTLARSVKDGRFLASRIQPELRDESRFPVAIGIRKLNAHFFEVSEAYSLDRLSRFMEERLLSVPKDLRDIYALGPEIVLEEECDYRIWAPEITGSPDKVLALMRHIEWEGFGLTRTTMRLDDGEFPWKYQWLGFSERH